MSPPSILIRDHALDHRDYVRGLTGLRGFAALWVFLYHAWVYAEPRLMTLELPGLALDLTPLFSTGWAGVDFFFVLSAFLLTLPFAHWACGEGPYPSIPNYLTRRFKRIFPAYWAQLLILLLVASLSSFYAFPSTRGLIAHAVMYFNLPPWWVSPLNGVWWTLPTEFVFYLLLVPLSLLLKNRWARLLLVALLGVAWAYRWWVVDTFYADQPARVVSLMGNTLGALDLFIIGTLAAFLYVHHRGRPARRPHPGLMFGLGVLGVGLVLYSIHWLYGFYWRGHILLFLKNTLIGISIASIIMAILLGSRLANALLSNRLMMHFGIISYSVYLWHFPIVVALSKWSFIATYEGYRLPLLLAFSAPATWAAAYCSYRWVERPFLVRRRASGTQARRSST
jgi:peptidoglycan/LPS O-acetylase OafA/YrhL